MDNRAAIRSIPLIAVLEHLGYTGFKKARDGWAGKCPFHNPEKNETAFRFTPDGLYNCFGCKAKGRGAITLTMELRKINFTAAVELLSPLVGYQLPAESQTPRQSENLSNGGRPGKTFNPASYRKFALWPSEWLDQRGITQETCEHFGVFHYRNNSRRSAYNDSVLIPFTDFETGQVAGFMSRNIGDVTADRPKYRVAPGIEKNAYLFGAFQLKEKAPVKVLFVVESPFCVMKFRQLGFDAVSPFGWSLSSEQTEMLPRLTFGFVYIPDRNKSEGSATVWSNILHQGRWLKLPTLPEGIEDPEQLDQTGIRSLLL